jgi:hypothetical protein
LSKRRARLRRAQPERWVQFKDFVSTANHYDTMKIVNILESTRPIKSDIRNAYIDLSATANP